MLLHLGSMAAFTRIFVQSLLTGATGTLAHTQSVRLEGLSGHWRNPTGFGVQTMAG